MVVVAFPSLFTSESPTKCFLAENGMRAGRVRSPVRLRQQGCDVFARVVYGARASVAVGVCCTLLVVLVGGVLGALAGFYGGWIDTVISRFTDIFFAIPLVLAAIVVLQVVKNLRGDEDNFFLAIVPVVLALAAFGWPQVTRIMRGAVLTVKNMEYIDAARAIGATRRRNLIRHVVPNALAPVIVVATVSLGIFIVAESTLSFLGLGLPPGVVSWGDDIAEAQALIRAGRNLGGAVLPRGRAAPDRAQLHPPRRRPAGRPRSEGEEAAVTQPLLEVKDLDVSFSAGKRQIPAVRGASLTVVPRPDGRDRG